MPFMKRKTENTEQTTKDNNSSPDEKVLVLSLKEAATGQNPDTKEEMLLLKFEAVITLSDYYSLLERMKDFKIGVRI